MKKKMAQWRLTLRDIILPITLFYMVFDLGMSCDYDHWLTIILSVICGLLIFYFQPRDYGTEEKEEA